MHKTPKLPTVRARRLYTQTHRTYGTGNYAHTVGSRTADDEPVPDGSGTVHK